jgi:hypothetical protein
LQPYYTLRGGQELETCYKQLTRREDPLPLPLH